MTLDYFYGQAGELFSFYRIPKAPVSGATVPEPVNRCQDPVRYPAGPHEPVREKRLAGRANRVFIIFTIEDVKRALCCADNKATKLLRELEKFGLIERKRRGLGKPSLVYVKNFSAESSKSIFQNRVFSRFWRLQKTQVKTLQNHDVIRLKRMILK